MSITASYTHPGRRRSNQDSVLVRSLGNGTELVAVADGMGGHSAGEVASAIALEALWKSMEDGLALEDAVEAANERVYSSAQENPEWQGMGTTLVVLLRDGNSYVVANVGDSRAYAIDESGIRQITDDHSYVAEAMRSGAMSEAEAARSPWRNALTRAIGTDAAVKVDVFGPVTVERPHLVLLCSDGLYKTLGEDLIREYLLSIDGLSLAMEALAALAYRRGSDDNITAAAIEFGALERRPPRITLPLAIDLQSTARAAKPRAAPSRAPRPAETRPTPKPAPANRASAPAQPSPVPAAPLPAPAPVEEVASSGAGWKWLLFGLLAVALIALLWWLLA